MNQERREKLRAVKDKLGEAKSDVESIKIDEDDARDKMPENLQGSERYEASEACSDAMENAIDSIDDAIDYILEAI